MRKCAVRIVRHAASGPCASAAGAASRTMTAQAIVRACAALKRLPPLILDASCPFVANAKTMFVMHGGAGTITRQNMTPEQEAQIRAKMEEALKRSEERRV